jgi:hypothetical protein
MVEYASKSYPYLAIAQHFNVPYGIVLKYADNLAAMKRLGVLTTPALDWTYAVYLLEKDK